MLLWNVVKTNAINKDITRAICGIGTIIAYIGTVLSLVGLIYYMHVQLVFSLC